MGDNARSFPRLLLVGVMSLLAAFTLLVATPAFDDGAQAQAKRVVEQPTDYDFLPSSIKNNCVFFARYMVPSLPTGLGTVEGQHAIINSKTPQAGAIAIYSYLHVSYVEKVNGNQITTRDGGFKAKDSNNNLYFTGHIARITGTEDELGIVGYWVPANIKPVNVEWWKSETKQNLGDDFYANMLLSSTWINATVNGSNYRIMNADRSKVGDTVNYRGIFWHFKRNSDDGSYQILNVYHKGRPLQASGTTSGSYLQLGSSYTGDKKQKWFIYRENGKRIIRNAASDFVINVDSAKSDPGANWQIWNYTDSAAERINIYKHTPAQATALSVKAGTMSDATTFTWKKPSTGETAYYNLRITALDSDGNATSTKYDAEKIDAADTSKTVQLPEGKYSASIETCSWFNTASSATVTFEVKNTDTEAPTISEAKVTSVTDSAVTIVVKAHDNVGIAEKVKIGEADGRDISTQSATYGDYIEVGVPGSGEKSTGALGVVYTIEGLGDTAKKDATITFKITRGLIGGHHFGVIAVRDVNNNSSGPVYVEFDKAVPSSVIVNMSVGDSQAAESVLGHSTVGWRARSAGDQDIINVTTNSDSGSQPIDIVALNAGTCTIIFENPKTGEFAYRKFVVVPTGQEVPTVDPTDRAAADSVTAAIWALPESEDVTLDDAAAIEAAAQELNRLTPEQEALIVSTTYAQLTTKLGAAQDALAAAQQDAADADAREKAAQANQQAVKNALDAVDNLPDSGSLTLANAQDVYAAQNALSNLTDAQMECISASDWVAATTKLQAALDKIDELLADDATEAADKAAADDAANEVAASEAANAVADLPAVDDLTVDDEAAVNAAKAALDALTPEQKAKLSNYADLVAKVDAAAAKIEELKASQGGDDPAKATDISKATVKLESTSMPYHMGRAIKPKVTIDGLKEGVDFTVYYSNNREVGDSAQVEVVGTGNCTGRQTLTFSIVRADIAQEFPDLAVDKASYAYTGKAIKPGVKSDTWDLESDYYTLSYANNTEIGTATVTVKGKGGYTGSKKLTFAINPPKVTLSKAKAGKKKISVKAKAAKGGVKYQVSYRVAGGKWVNKTSKKATYTAKKLKSGKKYQVKVRAMKTVGGKTYYGAWSKTKTVKVK